MNLYRSRTATGLVWSGTQAGAKALQGDKDFEHIDVPTSKAELIDFLNGMENRVVAALQRPDLDATWVRHVDLDVDPESPPASVEKPQVARVGEGECVACNRSKAVAKLSVNSQAALSIKADLEDVSDRKSLMQIIELAQLRLSAVIEASVAEKSVAEKEVSED